MLKEETCMSDLSLYAYPQTAVLEKHLRSHGGVIVDHVSQLPYEESFMVVPYSVSALDASTFVGGGSQPTFVTNLWIERCIFLKALEDPLRHVMSTPFSRCPIAGESVNAWRNDGAEFLFCRLRRSVHLLHWLCTYRTPSRVSSCEAGR